MIPDLGVVTIVAGRRDHLRSLLEGLARQRRAPARVVIVAMDREPVLLPPGFAAEVAPIEVVRIGVTEAGFPLAAARNAGIDRVGTEHVVLLDVDVIPGTGLIEGYGAALGGAAAEGLVCGELRYLPPGVPDNDVDWSEPELLAQAKPAAARPAVAPGELRRDDQHLLAWTTTLAFSTATCERIGGFDERFLGYGAEDTDFGVRARATGVGVWWSGDAIGFHRDHDGGESGLDRRRRNLPAIVRNATLFAELHGWWPMGGWLEEFRELGLVDFDPDRNLLQIRDSRS